MKHQNRKCKSPDGELIGGAVVVCRGEERQRGFDSYKHESLYAGFLVFGRFHPSPSVKAHDFFK